MEPVNEPFGNTAKLAEIRNAMILFDNRVGDDTLQISRDFHQESAGYVRFLLSEIDRLQSIQQERDKLLVGIQRAKRLLDNPMAAGAYKAGVLDVFREIGVGEERTEL